MAKMSPLLAIHVVLLACCVHSIQGDGDDERVVVNSGRLGKVRGIVKQADNGAKVNVFLGVPYGVPPVGEKRFQKSRWPPTSEETIEADKMPPACPQYSDQPLPWYDLEPGQSEDCLYMNIWAPANRGKMNRPVKFYVHGGGWFDAGSNRMPYYDGFGEAIDTIDEDGKSKEDGIVVVTINYRLGVLGFFYNKLDEWGSGNVGYEDVWLAYWWTKKIIKDFGGGPVKAEFTVEGEGSGAILVSLMRQYASEQFKSVLNGATFLTLQALEGVEFPGDSSENNWRLGNLLSQELGCGSLETNNTYAMSCLREVEVSRLVKAAWCLSRGRGPPNVFLPFIKNENKPYHPYFFQYNQDKKYFDKYLHFYDTLSTFSSDAGSAVLTTAFPKVFGAFGEENLPLTAACAKAITRRLLKRFNTTLVDELLGDLDKEATLANRDKVVQAVGDAFFNCPMIFHAEDLKKIKRGTDGVMTLHLLQKQVNPPYNPWADWMGSVGFDNVQIDFLHTDGQLTLNNQTYTYTDEQTKQVRVNLDLIRSHMSSTRELPFPEFTLEDPAYGFLNLDSSVSDDKNFHGHNCDILRPFFKNNVTYEEYGKRLGFNN